MAPAASSRPPPIGRSPKTEGRDWLPAGGAALAGWAGAGGGRRGPARGPAGARRSVAAMWSGHGAGRGRPGRAGPGTAPGVGVGRPEPPETETAGGGALPQAAAATRDGGRDGGWEGARASPPLPHGLSLSPLRDLRHRVRHGGQLGACRQLHAVPGRLRLSRRHSGGEEAGRAGAGPRAAPGRWAAEAGGAGRWAAAARQPLTAPPFLAENPLPEHRALHRVAVAGRRAGRRDLPDPRRGDLAGGRRGKAASGGAAGQTDSFPGAFPDKLFPLPTQVTIMGIIRHAEKAPTNILYKVDDMTAAPMDVRQWVDTDVSIRFVMDTLL